MAPAYLSKSIKVYVSARQLTSSTNQTTHIVHDRNLLATDLVII